MTDRDDDGWERLQQLFEAAMERSPDERREFVAQECSGDPELQSRLEGLLAASQQADQILETSEDGGARWLTALGDVPARVPPRIGRYRIRRLIATGGMGTVYEAEQEHPRRTVAIKVMRWAMSSPSVQRRFQYESELLARLRHPGIAQVFEAGTYDDGGEAVPYYAMEYVPDARPITEHAQQQDLGFRQRLELFAEVCDAVNHGHEKGVIHRDLKPSNILVDGEGHPRMIDFGVARLIDADTTVRTLQTETGQLLGTLQYMSPEQCEADPHNIDTRSDVYALGVVLYELLCGKPPYDVTTVPLHEATRVVREQAPTRLSSVDVRLGGDVETIIQKALEKDRDRRYRSAADLADDIRRYLAGEAITARPPSVAYQLRVFARRNKVLVAGVAAVFLALTLGIIGTSLGMVQATRQREEAEAVTKFLSDALASVDPVRGQGQEVKVRDVLDQVAQRIETEAPFSDRSLAEATLRMTIGTTYRHLGLIDKAQPHLERALAIRRSAAGNGHAEVAESLYELGLLLRRKGNSEEAETRHLEVLALHRQGKIPDMPAVAGSLREVGTIRMYAGDRAEAESMLHKALVMFRELLGDENQDVAWCLNNLGMLEGDKGDRDASERYHRQALSVRLAVLGPDHPDNVYSYANLGKILMGKPNIEAAEKMFTAAVNVSQAALGNSHHLTGAARGWLGYCLREQGRYERAEKELIDAHDILRSQLGEDHDKTFNNVTWLLVLYEKWGSLGNHGDAWLKGEAEPMLRRVLEKARADRGNKAPFVAVRQAHLGACLSLMGRYEEAEKQLEEAYRVLDSANNSWASWVTKRLEALDQARGKRDEAAY